MKISERTTLTGLGALAAVAAVVGAYKIGEERGHLQTEEANRITSVSVIDFERVYGQGHLFYIETNDGNVIRCDQVEQTDNQTRVSTQCEELSDVVGTR